MSYCCTCGECHNVGKCPLDERPQQMSCKQTLEIAESVFADVIARRVVGGDYEERAFKTIRAALKVLDEVQKYPVSSGSTWNDAVAHTINHLKQIAGE